ncbi:DUF418 domain-containing protein [Amycolatopsis sp. Poz14]|uniref:DUF418 domain-containing protein n=1 Tax=Amycolatopsis sp. Poz14 TaxID=1447705 RepID=UPI001EE832E8|nr:DUF418 domain-containing protein [Amycolatopsis sp. Poz14]MCG3755335.1 DUF418 domain-containing protein [Amycolatopsis sp. Poz14]
MRTEAVRDPAETRVPKGRLLGVDAVRALAIVGVFIEHFFASGWLHGGPPDQAPGFLTWLNMQTSSRAMSLFVLLFGLSAALMTGGAAPYAGNERWRARGRLAIRAVVLFVLSLAIDEYGMSVIEYYAVLLLLLLPLTRLRARTLFVLSGIAVPAVTLYAFWVFNSHSDWLRSGAETASGLAIFAHPEQWGEFFKGMVLFGGGFQVAYGLPLALAGMAIGRLDLRAHQVRIRLLYTGFVLATASILGSWIATYPLGGADAIATTPPPGMPWQVLLAMPTDGSLYATSPLGIVLMIGVAMVLLGGLLIALDRPLGRRALWPLAAAGGMAFTWYAAHFAVLKLVPKPYSFVFLATVVAVMLAASVAWRHWRRRGPLEWLVHRATLLVP